MLKRSGTFYFTVLMLLSLLLSLTGPLPVYADEGTPPPVATQSDPATPQAPDDKNAATDSQAGSADSAAPASAQGADVQSAASSSQAATQNQSSSSQEAAGSVSSAAASQVSSGQSSSAPAASQPAQTQGDAPILQQVPDGTSVVVLNPDGSVEPLATQQASNIIAGSDPVWCPSGQTPGAAGCTPSQATITDLLTYIQNVANNVSGSGTIYFQNGSYAGSETSVSLDGNSLTNLTDLGLEGGWDLTTNTQVAGGTTTFSVPVSVINWLGNVSVTNINTTATNPTAALTVTTSGDITLANVDAGSNTSGNGAYLDNCAASSGNCTGTGNIAVTDSSFNNNNGSGIFAQSAGNIALTNTDAQTNGFYGADLVNSAGSGDVQVTNGNFSNNDDVGLSAISTGDVTQDTVTADSNNTGSIVDTTGSVTITNGAYDNNTWTGAQVTAGGDVSVDQSSASGNGVTGADLNTTSGTGGITVTNSTFNNNGQVGLKAISGSGNILVDNSTFDGGGVSHTGAWLKTFDGGQITVQNSTFTNNLEEGLTVVSSNTVNLNNVTATNNGSNGAQVYSTYAYACFGPKGIDVNVNGGIFQNNGGYGLFVAPGPLGTLTFGTAPLFGLNTLGDSLLTLDVNCSKCDGNHSKPDEYPKKPVKEVKLPATGGDPVAQDCDNYSGTLLELPNGTSVNVDCPFRGDSLAEEVGVDGLPAAIPPGPTFVSGVSVGLTSDGQPVTSLGEDSSVTISFDIPEGMDGKKFYILYWDPTANNGQGDWVELPLAQFPPSSFPLNPQNPDDTRTISSGVQVVDGQVTVTVNFPGTFALVAR